MRFTPKLKVNRVTDISIEKLKENGIKGIILDVDNTLIDLDGNLLEGVGGWIENAKKANLKICIASNNSKKSRVEAVAKKLDLKYIYFAKKPLKGGLNKARKILGIKDSNKIAEIGDQVFTDVWGSNRMGMFSILTVPFYKETGLFARLRRKLEKIVLKKQKGNG